MMVYLANVLFAIARMEIIPVSIGDCIAASILRNGIAALHMLLLSICVYHTSAIYKISVLPRLVFVS